MRNSTLPRQLSGVGSWHWQQKRRCRQLWENKGITNIKRIIIRKVKQKNKNQHLYPDNQPTPHSQGGEDWLLFRECRTVCPSSTEMLQMPKVWTLQRSLLRMTHMCQMWLKGLWLNGGRLLEGNEMCELPTKSPSLCKILQSLQKRKRAS